MCWGNWLSAKRNLKLDPCFSQCTCINSEQIKDLKIRPENMKLVQERVRNTMEHIGISNNILKRTPVAQQLRKRIDK
jgi:hypothetical protein